MINLLNVPSAIDDYAKDGGEELFTKMHCILGSNSNESRQGFVIRTQCILVKSSSPPSLAQLSIRLRCVLKMKVKVIVQFSALTSQE